MRSLFLDVRIPRIVATKVLSHLVPSVYYSSLSPVRLATLPDRELPGPRWVRVENRLAGICGSDVSFFFIKGSARMSAAALPGIRRVFLGHEVAGRVMETGDDVTDLKEGDRVTLQKLMPCCSTREITPPCRHCALGNYTLCENVAAGDSPENLGQGFGDHFIAHRSQLLAVPNSITDEQAVFLEPLSVAIHSVLKSPPADGEKVLVIGAGTIGLGVIQFAKALCPGCQILLLERCDAKKRFATRLGADLTLEGDPYQVIADATDARLYRGPFGNTNLLGGLDVVYDCVGSSRTIHDSLRWLGARGRYVLIGNQFSPASFDHTPFFYKEISLVGVNAHGMEELRGRRMSSYEVAMEMIQRGELTTEGMITHRFALDDYREAFKTVRERPEEVIKAVFEL